MGHRHALPLVFAGGVLGTGLRYLAGIAGEAFGAGVLATLAVNVAGAFLLGLLLQTLSSRGPETPAVARVRLFLGTGALGSFTTYSALAVETVSLSAQPGPAAAAAYTAASIVLGLLAALAGILAAGGGRASAMCSRPDRAPR
ncbi:CrcB family protein [Nocardiopsis sp. ARC36]